MPSPQDSIRYQIVFFLWLAGFTYWFVIAKWLLNTEDKERMNAHLKRIYEFELTCQDFPVITQWFNATKLEMVLDLQPHQVHLLYIAVVSYFHDNHNNLAEFLKTWVQDDISFHAFVSCFNEGPTLLNKWGYQTGLEKEKSGIILLNAQDRGNIHQLFCKEIAMRLSQCGAHLRDCEKQIADDLQRLADL